MNKILRIGKMNLCKNDENVRLFANIYKDKEEPFTVFYEYNITNVNIFDTCFADSFFVALVPYAMEFGYDIVCDNPLSSQIYYQYLYNFIPVLSKRIKEFNNIKIKANILEKPLSYGTEICTGVSCGVDSLFTIIKHSKLETKCPSSFRLTSLCLMNTGACSWEGGQRSFEWFLDEVARAKIICNELGLKLITINTNLMEFYGINQKNSGYSRMVGPLLALDNYFKIYYFASGFEIDYFGFKEDDGDYLIFTCGLWSTCNIKFIPVGNDESRDDRIKYISNFPISYRTLNVCWSDSYNCNKCEKCLRTMGSLYSIDKLDFYWQVFDVQLFYKKIFINLAKMMYYKKKHIGMYDFLDIVKKNKKSKYFFAKTLYLIYVLPCATIKKIGKIILPKKIISKIRGILNK